MKVLPAALLLPILLNGQTYYPPVAGTWDTLSPATLGWCTPVLDTLDEFLDDHGTKAFLILKDGRMAYERYFGNFNQDSVWYWASAGKSLAAALTGEAQANGYLDINQPVSSYLGTGWTNAPLAKENLITVRHLLSMTSGLDDGVTDPDCSADSCLEFLADAGTRWAYHNGAYHVLHDVLEQTTGQSMNLYTYQALSSTGISGLWVDGVFFSKPRSLARFGLLVSTGGRWNGSAVLTDSLFLDEMTATSQSLNPSYGYLWWLNGKGSHMLPQSQVVFPTDLVPAAPDEVVMALGKNDQKLYLWKEEGIVVVRLGNSAGQSHLASSSFDNQLWNRLSALFCTLSAEEETLSKTVLWPNPVTDILHLGRRWDRAEVFNATGCCVLEQLEVESLSLGTLPAGLYTVRLVRGKQVSREKVLVK